MRSCAIRLRFRRIAGLLALGAALTGCDRLPWAKSQAAAASAGPSAAASRAVRQAMPARPVDPAKVIAEVNGRLITVEEFHRRVRGLAEEYRPKSLEDKKRLLEELIGVELIVQDAKARGLGQDPEVVQRLDDLEQVLLYQEAVQREMAGVAVTDAEAEKFYKDYQVGFKEPERVRLKQLVVKTEADAKAILVTLLQGTSTFEQIVRERSVGPAAAQGGDVGYVIRAADKAIAEQSGQAAPATTSLFPQLEQAAFALEVGGISGIIKGPEGYYIVKLVERKEGSVRPLTEVWQQVRDGLLLLKQQQHFQEKLGGLRGKARVTVYEDKLGQL
ncbi:MAG: peptidyl-prolyl cis-trans isomerase [Candidatus Omnitrophica bacterium]|nr:peptidyl-prolyl cis-trans isomerase [Candidatus Omnitrophota bacterium]